jgi:hypothetical protein
MKFHKKKEPNNRKTKNSKMRAIIKLLLRISSLFNEKLQSNFINKLYLVNKILNNSFINES